MRWRVAIGACGWLFASSGASAHVAQARSAVFSASGTAIAVSLPGFGVALRRDGDPAFSYVCDALLEVAPSDSPPPMAFTEGSTLLVGTGSGLRTFAPNGCPDGRPVGELRSLPVVALAVHPRSTSLVYAVVQREGWRLSRSEDAGQTWEVLARLPTDEPVSALMLDDVDTNAVYVSQTVASRAIVLVSTDGARSFSALPQDASRILLDIQRVGDAATEVRFWAAGRPAGSVGNRGFELLRASAPGGPWSSVLQVNFFGGFAIEPGGAIWVGDEGGGVYRSLNEGASFDDVAPGTPVAHLNYAQEHLWACTPGLATERALAQWSEARTAFDDVLGLDDVTRMVDCGPDVDVRAICAAAWAEWQRDVLMSTTARADAGTPDDGDAASVRSTGLVPSGGCTLTRRAGSSGALNAGFWLALALSLAFRRREPWSTVPRCRPASRAPRRLTASADDHDEHPK